MKINYTKILEQAYEEVLEEAKKKKSKKGNPWAICTSSVGRKDKDKYEKCVMDVKAKQK